MDQRLQFVEAVQRGHLSVTALCADFGISRKTGYKWLARMADGGRAALADRSRAPHHCPHRIPAQQTAWFVAARQAHPTWGAGKLRDWLQPRHPAERTWPAISTINDLLARHGLLRRRRRQRRRESAGGRRWPAPQQANALWSADFKGQFRTRDRCYCYPLTILDGFSRYLLTCQQLASTRYPGTRRAFERAFRCYGLPEAMRTDNGPPFASTGLRGLSRLRVWWLQLGIALQRIPPGQPQHNGAHERMHKTLKREAIRPPRATARAQQRAFDRFRVEYNTDRPHAALGGVPPARYYHASPRPYPSRLPPPSYPGHYCVRRVTTAGTIRFHNRLVFLSTALTGHDVGLEEIDDGIWAICFMAHRLATMDERDYRIHE
jgi:transposase InsO family protein